MFTRIDATTSTVHLRNFSRCVNAFLSDPPHQHDDVYMKIFSLSLDGRDGEWYNNLPHNSFSTLATFKIVFTNMFGENKEHRHQLAALKNIKKENQHMDDFNQRFTKLSNAIPTTYKPPTPSILTYYIEELSGKMQYHIRDKEPTTLLNAQELEVKIDQNMYPSGESNLPSYSRSSTTSK